MQRYRNILFIYYLLRSSRNDYDQNDWTRFWSYEKTMTIGEEGFSERLWSKQWNEILIVQDDTDGWWRGFFWTALPSRRRSRGWCTGRRTRRRRWSLPARRNPHPRWERREDTCHTTDGISGRTISFCRWLLWELVQRKLHSGFMLWLVLSPLANFTENWLNKNFEFWPIFANFTKIRAEIGPIWLN